MYDSMSTERDIGHIHSFGYLNKGFSVPYHIQGMEGKQ